MKTFVIVNNLKDWSFKIKNIDIIEAKSYLTDKIFSEIKSARVFNLCRSYKYQSTGYYVSLLAEARGHRIFPNVSTIQDLKTQSIVRSISDDFDELIQKNLSKIKAEDFTLSIYFGQNVAKQYSKLAAQISSIFQAPLMKAHFVYNKNKWLLNNISVIPVNDIPTNHLSYIEGFAASFFNKQRIHSPKVSMLAYDLAILVNPEEEEPPSNKKAIQQFINAGEELGIRCELITKEDYGRLPEFDALFIRETTSVNHYTYRFARRAFTEGLVVIDDPYSILRCANKVYLAEMLSNANIPTPKTLILHKDNKNISFTELSYPIVLKQPDSSFSLGVIKVENQEQFKIEVNKIFETSDLIIAQEFTYSEFDWRIGIIDGRPLYVCKYFMAKDHWQIYNWKIHGKNKYGNFETVPVYQAPKKIVSAALRSANIIGKGLYGVDVKEIDEKPLVIEVNDNPSIDVGVEDQIMGEHLYYEIMRVFKERIESSRKERELSI